MEMWGGEVKVEHSKLFLITNLIQPLTQIHTSQFSYL